MSLAWKIPGSIIQIVGFEKKIFICCDNGLYELIMNDSCDEESDDDEEIFYATPRKRQCLTLTKQYKEAILRVKFKKAVIACSQSTTSSSLYTLHLKHQSQVYAEATDLQSFNCINPNVFTIDSDKNWELMEERPWIKVICNQPLKMFVYCWGEVYNISLQKQKATKSKLSTSSISPMNKSTVIKTKFTSMLDLYLKHEIKRPKLTTNDLIEKIIDSQEIICNEDSPMFSTKEIDDLDFLDRECLITLNQGQLLQYSKENRKIRKTHMALPHVQSFFKDDGKNLVVLTKCGSIFKITPNPKSEHHISLGPPKSLEALIENSKDLERLNGKRTKLEQELNQLRICLRDDPQFEINVLVIDDMQLEFNLLYKSDNDILYGKYWSLVLSLHDGTTRTFPCSEHVVFKRNTKWKVRVSLDKNVQISDLPLKISSYMLFKLNGKVLLANVSQQNILTSIDFISVKSNVMLKEIVQDLNDEESFENFVESINVKRVFHNCDIRDITTSSDSKTISITLRLDFNVLITSDNDFVNALRHMDFLHRFEQTLSVELFNVPITISLEKHRNGRNMKITITGKALDYILQIKQDLLHMNNNSELSKIDTETSYKMNYLLHLLKTTEEEGEKNIEEKLKQCYKKLREITSTIDH